MTGSLATRLGYKALASGIRVPRISRLQQFNQQSRTIEEIQRLNVNLVLDVGANKGFYSKHLRMLGFAGEILSFEPDPETFYHLEAMAKGDPKWRVFNCALGDRNEQIDFHVIKTGDETVLSSVLKPLGEIQTAIRRVPIRRLADLLPAEGVSDQARIFLKMDTQGYDLEVFNGSENPPNIVLLQSEVSISPLYECMPHYTESLLRFENSGFELLDLFVVNRTETGSILEYDALMARRSA